MITYNKYFNFIFIFIFLIYNNYSFSQSFQIISISPSFNKIANNINPEVIIDFNLPVEPTSFDSISFSVVGERTAYHRGNLEFLSDNKTASFSSHTNFNAGEKITVRLTKKILSNSGDSLRGFVWTFLIPTNKKKLSFSNVISYGGGGIGMQCVDMNQDGYPDIVTSSGVILINDGNGDFPVAWELDDADGFYPIVVNDFNRDDFSDVIYRNSTNLVIGLGNGSGGFSKIYYPLLFHYYVSLDVNMDGYPDLVGINDVTINPPYDTTSFWAVSLNDGTGHLQDTIQTSILSGAFQRISSFDIENDGDDDIIVFSHPSLTPNGTFGLDGFAIFKNNGAGYFDETELYPTGFYLDISASYSHSISDFNNDSFLDIATLGSFAGTVTLNDLNGNFIDDTTHTRNFWGAEQIAPITAGNIDGDNWLDIVISGYEFPPKLPETYYAVAPNNFSYFNYFNNNYYIDTLPTSVIYSTALADLDNNGSLDIVHSGTGVLITLADDSITYVNIDSEIINNFQLQQNYPNPFNSFTNIIIKTNSRKIINISVFNLLGEEVRLLESKLFLPGEHKIAWDGKDSYGLNVPSGIYFIKADSYEDQQIIKSVVLK